MKIRTREQLQYPLLPIDYTFKAITDKLERQRRNKTGRGKQVPEQEADDKVMQIDFFEWAGQESE